MKKLVLFIAVVTAFLFSNEANAQLITRGSIINPDGNKIASFYIMDNPTGFYWGCSSEFIKNDFARNFYRLETDKKQMIVAIKTSTRNQQQTLTIALTRMINEKHLSEKESFNKIFSFYYQNQHVPNWEYILLHEI